jgi:hypothetical protein
LVAVPSVPIGTVVELVVVVPVVVVPVVVVPVVVVPVVVVPVVVVPVVVVPVVVVPVVVVVDPVIIWISPACVTVEIEPGPGAVRFVGVENTLGIVAGVVVVTVRPPLMREVLPVPLLPRPSVEVTPP